MIIFVNGPPSSGKDTAAEIMCRLVPGMGTFVIGDVLDAAICDLFAMNHPQHKWCKYNKDTPTKVFGDETTYRKVKISLAEDWMKTNFGEDIFGRISMKRIGRILDKIHFVIPGVGFHYEVVPIIRGLASKHEIRLLKITRPNCDFSIDSRDWVDGVDLGIREDTINNRHDLELYEEQIKIWLRSVKLLPKAG